MARFPPDLDDNLEFIWFFLFFCIPSRITGDSSMASLSSVPFLLMDGSC